MLDDTRLICQTQNAELEFGFSQNVSQHEWQVFSLNAASCQECVFGLDRSMRLKQKSAQVCSTHRQQESNLNVYLAVYVV